MKTFVNSDFMLHSSSAQKLYHEYAQKMPIFDFHCHLNPKEIAEDKRFSNLTELWLSGDHYKWRLMRAHGVEEMYITGDSDPYEKFLKWAETVQCSVENPLYHWTHLELKRYFGIDELLSPKTAPAIWAACNAQLKQPDFSARGILRRFHVEAVSTTDDPVDDLQYHRQLAEDSTFLTKVLPTFRPDKALHVENAEFRQWVETLGEVCKIQVDSFETLVKAMEQRAEFFRDAGCRSADHSFASPDFTVRDRAAAEAAFRVGMSGCRPTDYEVNAYQTALLTALGRIYHRLGFVMQLHLGVIRGCNTRMTRILGADTGFDSIGDPIPAASLVSLLDGMEQTQELPKTVLYTLNDNDNAKFAAVAGCFQGALQEAKVQFGAAWWFNDHKDGMVHQMKALANSGLLSASIGMLTDSRSFLSYTRHEYFRRILCDLLGGWMEDGEAPMDFEWMGNMVENICFNNAVRYFNI